MRPKFWSLGTHLGSLGPGSQGDVGLGSCRLQFLVIWGPNECPALMACQGTAENPNLIGAQCETINNMSTKSFGTIGLAKKSRVGVLSSWPMFIFTVCTSLAIFLIVRAYNEWQDNPVLTSIQSTGMIDFKCIFRKKK